MSRLKKIGILDIIIIIFVIIGLIYISRPFMRNLQRSDNTQKINYVFETVEVKQEFIDQLEIGADIFNSSTDQYLGEIRNFKISPYRERIIDTNEGKISLVVIPDLYNVIIDIEADGNIESNRISIDNFAIRAGLYLSIKGKGFASYGYIVSIERGDS